MEEKILNCDSVVFFATWASSVMGGWTPMSVLRIGIVGVVLGVAMTAIGFNLTARSDPFCNGIFFPNCVYTSIEGQLGEVLSLFGILLAYLSGGLLVVGLIQLLFRRIGGGVRDQGGPEEAREQEGGDRMTIGYYLEGLRQYQSFDGRASRAEFWWFNGVLYAIQLTIVFLGNVLGVFIPALLTVATVMLWVHGLGTLIPQLAVMSRRLHDTGQSAWLMLLLLVPVIGWIPLLVFLVLPSARGSNAYGRAPYR